ncbi:hypothetical protein COF68_04805 [Bacillus toyonensis]|uniref:hypothetical protein n=1 Tax=Bacillus toyonensis TaxID=155322 RepID=UPI000BFDD522|nr:hypothetical protein [Bacillus toyonensis]PHE64171.1 hypothetical protein COF68_04805 [Bacillus toyonensis]
MGCDIRLGMILEETVSVTYMKMDLLETNLFDNLDLSLKTEYIELVTEFYEIVARIEGSIKTTVNIKLRYKESNLKQVRDRYNRKISNLVNEVRVIKERLAIIERMAKYPELYFDNQEVTEGGVVHGS